MGDTPPSRDRHPAKDNNPSGSSGATSNASSGTGNSGGGILAKLLGRGSSSRQSSHESIPFQRTKSDGSNTTQKAGSSNSGGNGSPITSPSLGPIGGRDKKKSGLGSAEVISGFDDQDHDSQLRKAGKGPEETSTSTPSNEKEEISLEELIGVVKGDSHLASVPGGMESRAQAEATRLLAQRLNRARDQARIERELKRSFQDQREEALKSNQNADAPSTSLEDHASHLNTLPDGLSTRDQLLDLALPLCTVHAASSVRTAGFDLLAAVLRLTQKTISPDGSVPSSPLTEKYNPSHQPWALAQVILTLPTRLPDTIPAKVDLTAPSDLPSSQYLDICGRVSCLIELTYGGVDISCDLGMVKHLIQWLNLVSIEWVKICAQQPLSSGPTQSATAESLTGGTNNGPSSTNASTTGSTAPSTSESVTGLGMSNMTQNDDADKGMSTARSSLATTTSKTTDSKEASASDYCFETVLLLSDLILMILTNNFPLFTSADISLILNIYHDTIKRGIRHTAGTHPLLSQSFPGYGRLDSLTPAAAEAPGPQPNQLAERMGSVSTAASKMRTTASKGTPTAAISTETSPVVGPTTTHVHGRIPSAASSSVTASSLSRHSSVRSRGEKGLATTAITTGEGKLTGDLPPPEKPAAPTRPPAPFWSTLIPFMLVLVRTLLKAKQLSPLDLPGLMSLFSLCLGWRAVSTTCSPFRLDSQDRSVIVNALDARDRDGIVVLVRDIILSQMIGRSGEKALRNVLGMNRGRGRERSTYHVSRDEGLRGRDRLLGVICLLRELLKSTHHNGKGMDSGSSALSANFSLASFTPSLLSAMRFSHPEASANTLEFADAWHDIDLEILEIVDDHLRDLAEVVKSRKLPVDPATGQVVPSAPSQDPKNYSLRIRDAWTEGELMCQYLERAAKWITMFNEKDGRPMIFDQKTALEDRRDGIPAVDQKLTRLFVDVPVVLAQMQSAASFGGFYHPDFVSILLQLSDHLTDETALNLLDYYEREGICLPPTEKWTQNINQILQAFYIVVDKEHHTVGGKVLSTEVRRRTAHLVFKHVYEYVQEFDDLRNEMVHKVLLDLCETQVLPEADPVVEAMAWAVVVDFVVADSVASEEERRASQLQSGGNEGEEAETRGPITDETFDRIRAVGLKSLSRPCESHMHSTSKQTSLRMLSNPSSARREGRHGRGDEDSPISPSSSGINFKGLMDAMSPLSSSKELPSLSSKSVDIGTGADVNSENISNNKTAMLDNGAPDHQESGTQSSIDCSCKHTVTAEAMVTIFCKLTFSLPPSLREETLGMSRLPASSRCIILFKDMLKLIAPQTLSGHHHDSQGSSNRSNSRGHSALASTSEPNLSVICPKARVVVLQWFFRMRATQEHRIWVKADLNSEAINPARVLNRTQAQIDALKLGRSSDDNDSHHRRAGRPDGNIERGRVDRSMQDGTGRSRSRSRQPTKAVPYNPVWAIPETVNFETPINERPSEGMITYDPGNVDGSSVDGFWLPIAAYLSTINDILEHDSDWEAVSYVLTFLPLQLANRHFFCGPRSKVQIRRLRRIVCDGLINDRLIQNAPLPPSLRKADVREVSYQLLNIIVSYKESFDKGECNGIVETLYRGLFGIHRSTIKTCVRALTIAAYELPDCLVTYLPGVLEQLSQIMGTPPISLHILEFLCSIGQIPALYTNFTDMQYKAVFQVAMKYIEIHHDEENKALATAAQNEDPEYVTLTQHVLKLSFFVIYTWYMALPLPKRVSMYPHILRQLILCFPGEFDEMAEVCFDWLTRYTYGNADPKPTASKISCVTMHSNAESPLAVENKRTKYWILGNSVISITAQPRSGWATLTVRRASGTVAVLCKIENVATLMVGDKGADLSILPAMMRGDREEDVGTVRDEPKPHAGGDAEDHEDKLEQGLNSEAKDTEVVSLTPQKLEADPEFIWSESSPSQRRKDVVIDPGFLGLQLSAYPYISAHSPRGRFLPLDPTVERTLRNLDRIPVIDTQGIAVLYVGPGQSTEDEILSNTNGSPGFLRFMAGLGRLIKLKNQKDVYTGGLDTSEDHDGEYAYAWWDDLVQVIYHAPHLMPNPEPKPGSKPDFFAKKREVGNDFVKIVFNDSEHEYAFDTIKSEFQFVNIVISQHTPGLSGTFKDQEEDNFYKVHIQRAPGIPDFSAIGDFKLVSVKALPLVVRQIGYYATVISQLHLHTKTKGNIEYLTAWRQRWQKIQSLKSYLPSPLGEEEVAKMSNVDRRQILRDFTRGF